MSEESHPRTLYVGNLDATVSEDLLCAFFSQIAKVTGCKVIREPGNDPYAFLEFINHQGAATALAALDKRTFYDKVMKVTWAWLHGHHPKQDTSNHYHIFVGGLSPEIETQAIKDAFAPFGEISNCRIVRDPQTLKSKGYAFVSFVKKAEAENAIAAMNGQWLGSRSIRTNWSTRKPPPPRNDRVKQNGKKLPMQTSLKVHEALKPLSWLIGRWVGEGLGEFPTIAPFKYCEELEFRSIGQPLLIYESRTWHAEKKNPMHSESGFLRIKPGTREVAFMVSHNFGLSEVEEGQVEDGKLVVTSKDIIRMSFSKNPAVTQIHREYVLKGDILSLTLSMATTNTPLTKHLSVTYKKI